MVTGNPPLGKTICCKKVITGKWKIKMLLVWPKHLRSSLSKICASKTCNLQCCLKVAMMRENLMDAIKSTTSMKEGKVLDC